VARPSGWVIGENALLPLFRLFSRITPLARLTEALAYQDWEGNVRELKAEIERLALVCEKDLARMVSFIASPEGDTDRDRLAQLLEETGWNRREVARRLGISEGKVRYQIAKYGLDPVVKS
jgi:DNA-binding NtrC family response regulator